MNPSAGISQSVVCRPTSQPGTPPPNVPYANKELAKRWLEGLKLQSLPGELHDKVNNLDKKINTKGQPWDELRPDLERLLGDLQQQQQQQQQQLQMQLQFGAVLRDPRVDAVVERMQELEIAKQIKDEITTDMERTKERIQHDVDDNLNKIQHLKNDLAERDETIEDLKNKLRQLTKEKEEQENKIRSLENEIKELKREVGNLQLTITEKDKKIDLLMDIHSKRMDKVTGETEDMKKQIRELKDRNQELERMNESRIVVGETMKIMIKAIYNYVHPKLPKRKRTSYNVRDIGEHIDTKYRTASANDKQAAQDRWDKLKGELAWDEDTEDLIQELIDKRNQTAHPLKPPTDKIEFRNALRRMKEEQDIEDEDEGTAYDLYLQCKRKLKI